MSGSIHVKRCTKCNEEKPVELFYARAARCKECTKSAVRNNYQRNRDYYVAYDKRREQESHRKADKAEARKRHRAAHSDKYRARQAVANAIRSGALVKQPCEQCGSNVMIHAHHDDYSKPLDVRWLCKDCHWRHHNAENREAA